MSVTICLLRGINVGGHHQIKMEALRALCESLGLREVRTHLQSGNVVFKTSVRDQETLRKRLEAAIEREFGFHSDIVLRTTDQLRQAAAANPFVKRPGMEPNKLAVHFLYSDPCAEGRDAVSKIKFDPEELHIGACELYIYYTIGMARPKLSIPSIEKTLKTSGTSRNWNTVQKLLEIAESLEG
jgi:uncharacterized protein (DUF1697 family)